MPPYSEANVLGEEGLKLFMQNDMDSGDPLLYSKKDFFFLQDCCIVMLHIILY